jgi:hypothetical protein
VYPASQLPEIVFGTQFVFNRLRPSLRHTAFSPCEWPCALMMRSISVGPEAKYFPRFRYLQFLRSVELAQVPVERTQWQVPGLPSELEQETVGKAQCRPLAETLKRRRHNVRVL